MSTVSYRKTGDQAYLASDGTTSVEVIYSWLRVGGWQWIATVPSHRQWITGTTRQAAATRALQHLAKLDLGASA